MKENINSGESPHRIMEEVFTEIFKKHGYDVKCEGKTGNYLKMAGKRPDLILDGEIPVEVGTLSNGEKKIDEFFENGIEKVIWIPYPEITDLGMKMLIIEKRERYKEKNDELRNKISELKKEKEKLKEKNDEYKKYKDKYMSIRMDFRKDMVKEKEIPAPNCPNCDSELSLSQNEKYFCTECNWDQVRRRWPEHLQLEGE